jgi:putative tryptophan/tyrosine transport system substrate-binding protein
MDRRAFVAAVVFGTMPTSLAAEAQPGRIPQIGFLQPSARPGFDAFRQGLRDRGYIEGRNIVIEFREAAEQSHVPILLRELVAANVDVIVTWTNPAALAAKQATKTIPIVGRSRATPCEPDW